MISRCDWEWEGCDNREALSALKGQGRCWFGCDVVYQDRAGAGHSLAEWQLAFATLR